jgi:hypothetical protein
MVGAAGRYMTLETIAPLRNDLPLNAARRGRMRRAARPVRGDPPPRSYTASRDTTPARARWRPPGFVASPTAC